MGAASEAHGACAHRPRGARRARESVEDSSAKRIASMRSGRIGSRSPRPDLQRRLRAGSRPRGLNRIGLNCRVRACPWMLSGALWRAHLAACRGRTDFGTGFSHVVEAAVVLHALLGAFLAGELVPEDFAVALLNMLSKGEIEGGVAVGRTAAAT